MNGKKQNHSIFLKNIAYFYGEKKIPKWTERTSYKTNGFVIGNKRKESRKKTKESNFGILISNHLSNSKQKGKYTEREEKEAERGSGKKTKWNNTYTQTHHLVDSLNQIEIHGNRSINKTLSSFINKQKREPAPIFWSWSETNFLVKKKERNAHKRNVVEKERKDYYSNMKTIWNFESVHPFAHAESQFDWLMFGLFCNVHLQCWIKLHVQELTAQQLQQ